MTSRNGISRSRTRPVKHSSIVYAYCLDGAWHDVSEFYTQLCRNTDPARAVNIWRNDHRRAVRRGDLPPLDQQIEVGLRRGVWTTLHQMQKMGLLETENLVLGDPRASRVRLTDKALTFIRKMPGVAFVALRKFWEKGELEIVAIRALRPLTPVADPAPENNNGATN